MRFLRTCKKKKVVMCWAHVQWQGSSNRHD
jgi:hypothetical protein